MISNMNRKLQTLAVVTHTHTHTHTHTGIFINSGSGLIGYIFTV